MTALSPDSHTARRLEHATPEHLHLTTRRAFIGPIPEGWLKNNRKSWYRKYVPRAGDQTPTFTAAQPVPATEEPRGRDGEQTGGDGAPPRPSSQSAVTNVGAVNSTTSLLHGQRVVSITEQETQDANTSQADGGPVQQPSSRPLLPDTGSSKVPRVRFSESTKFQLRARAQRLASRGNLRSNKVKDGEVLKMDRMLVRIDITRQTLGHDFDEKVSAGVESRPMDKWREYMVVCRKHTEDDADSILQFYKTRVIAASSAKRGEAKEKPKAQVLLSPKRARVNMYSSLDKTLCVWTTEDARTMIYYLRPQSGATSVDWYTFLRGALGSSRAQTLSINVPDLSVSLRLDDPFRTVEASKLLAQAAEGDDNALARAMDDEKGAAGAIVARCIDMLKQSPDWTDVLKVWAQDGRIGLAWKRYDRLEWVYGAVEQRMYGTLAMQRTHELELRPKNHYPINTKTRKGDTIAEPPPVEGFLIRLTSQKGQERRMGKMLFKRLYFTTQNQHLLFLRPARATPPPPPKMTSHESGNVPTTKQLAGLLPLTYDVEPYALDGKDISWLTTEGNKRASEQKAYDRVAEAEAERNANMLLSCDGFVNMCNIKHVRKMHRGAVPADENLEQGSDVDFNFDDNEGEQDRREDDGAATEIDGERTFELVLVNGLIIRLQAYNKAAKHDWMRRLSQLVRYWKHRTKADMDLFKTVRQQNLEALQIDERTEALVGSFASKWEVSQSVASPVMYHMCGIAQCRTIHMSGQLFRKPRRHSTFTRCHVILSHGHLLVFQDTLRSRSGKKLVHIYHERIASIDLKGCYLYSGLLTENDLLYQNRTFDSNTPGHHALPRIYLEDGWTSTDEDAMTTFVIWHAKSKSWFRSSQFVDDVKMQQDSEERDQRRGAGKTRTTLTRVSQLGTTGRSVVFKARSRAERDHWVMGIQVEIERLAAEELAQGGEVRLVNDSMKK
ncbi:hypothetical protein LTR08_000178 [Meristemomyces frigidus]|nr:hypothetical protein LTR08_000178 [Meristemomyces frigidus]